MARELRSKRGSHGVGVLGGGNESNKIVYVTDACLKMSTAVPRTKTWHQGLERQKGT